MGKTLKFGNGTWATKKGSTLAYNDEDGNFKPLPFTYTGAGKGTRVNKEGLIEVVENDRPRIDYKDSEDGVFLLEKAATNLFPYSQYYGSGGLEVAALGTQTYNITNDYSVSPDGTQNALRFQATVGGSSSDRVILRDTLTSTAVDSTLSLYAKSNTTSNYTLIFHYKGGPRDTFLVTPEWKRFTYSELSNTINNIGIELKGDETSLEADVSLYGFQFENNSHATSYIPTQGNPQTRVQETASGSGNSEVFNDSQGVLFADFKINSSDAYQYLSLSDGSNSNNIRFNLSPTANQISFEINSGGSLQASYINNNTNVLLNTKVSVKYKQNDFSIWINGFKLHTDLSGSTPIGLDKINFDRGTGGNPFYGKTKELGYYDTALTDEELEYMTSYRSLSEMLKELNLKAL